MKTKEELAAIKAEYDDVKETLTELTDEELEQVSGGFCDLNGPDYGPAPDDEPGWLENSKSQG